MEKYGIEDAMSLYGIDSWGVGYFHISEEGTLLVTPTSDESKSVDLDRVVKDLAKKGVTPPVLLRFPQLLESQVRILNRSFRRAIEEFEYSKQYQPVFPIKVNQNRFVVQELLQAGFKYDLGLEVGSKPEMLAALALETSPESLLICNGFKDRAYLSTALLARKIGKNVIVVVEKPYELDHLIDIVKDRGIKPFIGFRIRLNSKGSGKWEKSGGVTSKFGLSTAQLIEGIRKLKDAKLIDCLKMFHFHIGSQITEIRRLKNAMKEAARVYAKAHKMGLKIEYLNVGGGLGIDYDGSKTSSDASVNYSIQEYANDVVYTIKDVCENENVPEPRIVSESGRAMVAYHSVLIVDVRAEISARSSHRIEATASDPQVIGELFFILKKMTVKNHREYYHDALEHRDEMFSLFNLGLLSLEERAKGEAFFWEIAAKAVRYAKTQKFVADEFVELEKQLHEKVVCNFSVFQSLPDHWAIDQLFPVVPIHRLREKPERRATLVDITCDSDGEIDKFVDLKDIKEALELHKLNGEPYCLAMLLIGAYQDTMGDLHNLFGTVNEAHVVVDDKGVLHIKRINRGDTVKKTLSAFGYDAGDLVARMKSVLEILENDNEMTSKEAQQLLSEYRSQFEEYTYLT